MYVHIKSIVSNYSFQCKYMVLKATSVPGISKLLKPYYILFYLLNEPVKCTSHTETFRLILNKYNT